MNKWEKVKLGDIGDFKSGGTPTRSKPEYFEGEIPWITTTSLGKTFIDEDDATTYISQEAVFNSATKLISKNSIMIGTRVGVGKVSINTVPMCTSQDIISIENINEEHFYKPYILHSINSYNRYFDTQKRGATIQGINSGVLKSIDIPKPPLGTQKQIAKTLDIAAELLAMRKHQLAELDNLIESTFYDMFGDPITNQMQWDFIRLEEIIIDVKNGITRRGKGDSNGSFVLKLKDIRENYIDFRDVNKFVLNPKESALFQVSLNQLLFIRVNGNPDYVGRCAVFNGYDQIVYYNDHIMRVNLRLEMINAAYLCRLINFPYGKREIKNHLKTSAGQYTINQQGLSNIVIPLPPLDLQNQFANIVTKIEEQKSLIKVAINETQHLFDSLMSEYFE